MATSGLQCFYRRLALPLWIPVEPVDGSSQFGQSRTFGVVAQLARKRPYALVLCGWKAARDGVCDLSETGDPRRVVTKGRTKEQAEREAIETRRLIARELAHSPPADSGDRKPPPGP